MDSLLFSFLKKIPTEDISDSEELRSQPKRLFKGIGDVPPTSEKELFVQKSTARHFAKTRPNTIFDGAALADNQLKKS